MPEKTLFHQWRETVSSRSSPKDSFRGMHLTVLHQAVRRKLDPQLSLIQFETHDFILCELKGRPSEMMAFSLPAMDSGIRWLCLQFHGKLSFPGGHASQPQTLFSFATGASEYLLTLAAEKQWTLLLGVSGASLQLLMAELLPLRELPDGSPDNGSVYPITFANRRQLDVFSRLAFGPFSTLHHIGQLLGHLYSAYAQQLEKPRGSDGAEPLMLLYHQAILFIQQHYMDEGLNRDAIAAGCNCSVRNLTRAFEGRSVSLSTAIRTLRLHKAKELLQKDPALSVEEIAAMLRFSNSKYFAAQYKKQFHRSPREERKPISPRK